MPKVNLLVGAPLTFYPWAPVTTAINDGDLAAPTATRITLADDAGNRVVFTGSFTIVAGVVTGGAVTGFTGYAGETATVRGSSYGIDATDLVDAIEKAVNTDDSQDLWDLLWYRPLVQVGSAGNDDISGTGFGGTIRGAAGNDTLWGGKGSEQIFGGTGNDWLSGGDGLDVLTGGTGRDAFHVEDFVFADRIADFRPKDDTIVLDYDLVEALGAGRVGKSEFVIGKKAVGPDHHLIYDKATGALYYDADANGVADQIKIAQLAKHLPLTANDFMVLA